MVTVKIISSQLVKPAEQTPQEVMYLSDCDQIKPVTHAPAVYFYRSATENGKTLPELIRMAKVSLSKALVKFYPVAGRLHWSNQGDKSGRVELHCNSMGALLVEAESDFRASDFGDFRPEAELRSLIPSVDLSGTPMEEVPLFLIQITRLRCGGVTLGTGFNHVVVDGMSALHFMAEWAKIFRGEESGDDPFLDRTVLLQQQQDKQRETDHHHPEKRDYKYSDFFHFPVLIGRADNLEERKKETVAVMLRLSKAHIQTLKNKANACQLDNNTLSRLDAVCAHVWKCSSVARGLRPEQETVMYVTVDFRNRISPPLPKRYFGNAVMAVPVSSTAGEVLFKPLSHVAGKIRAAVQGISDEYVRSYLNCIHSLPDVSQKRHFHTVGCTKGSFYGNPNLIVTSWLGLPLYEANMWGDEVRYMGPGSLGYDGRVFVMPNPDEDGSFLLPMRIQAEHAAAFQKYFYGEVSTSRGVN